MNGIILFASHGIQSYAAEKSGRMAICAASAGALIAKLEKRLGFHIPAP
jgi:hypothetical protein